MSLDKSIALRVFCIPESQYDELLLEFVDTCEEKLTPLYSALSKSEMAEAAAITHSIKGMAGNMMLDDCFTATRIIELSIKKGDSAGAIAGLNEFGLLIKEIRAAIGKIPAD